MTKKSILFINESLACAGGEKSLLNLLSSLDYDRYDISLQLFKYGCPWDKLIDPRVKVLPPLPYCKFTELPLSRAAVYSLKKWKWNWLWSRLRYSIALRTTKHLNNPSKAVLFWKHQGRNFAIRQEKYDYVIAYAQGIPTFYVADKYPGQKRLAWVNSTYAPESPHKEFIQTKYEQIDTIVAVSEEIQTLEKKHWTTVSDRVRVFRDLINPEMIEKLAQTPTSLSKDDSVLTLVTLGRMSPQKGYDIAIEAAAHLERMGVNFRWLILGGGILEPAIRADIERYNLGNRVQLLGIKSNPYPYLKLADIYVQTSRLEGFGLAIAEARLLNIPVVATRFNTVYMQMVDEKNGLVTDLDGKSVAEGIIRLAKDKQLYQSIVEYLHHEPKGNLETIPQFYDLLAETDKNYRNNQSPSHI